MFLMLRETHFWYVLPDEVKSEALLSKYRELLPQCEVKKVDSMRGDELRKGALLARALVRTTTARYQINTPVSPKSLEFRTNIHGKPEVRWHHSDDWLPPPLHFNISHTSSLVACGVTMDSPIGIDVEEKQRAIKNNVLSFARRYFSRHEVELLSSILDPEVQRQEFLKLWTLKLFKFCSALVTLEVEMTIIAKQLPFFSRFSYELSHRENRKFEVREISYGYSELNVRLFKEAYVKALGRGFSASPFNTFTIRFGPAKEGSFHLSGNSNSEESEILFESLDTSTHDTSTWQFALLELAGSHYASICRRKDIAPEGKASVPMKLKVWKTIPLVEDEIVSGTDSAVIIGGLS
ncbi:hypothetical protein RJ639_035068 [Escallonia herrerae]|uniref:holo-[acyl-carrier-protein] synthase n=1 Tax=Escallonia herrerae TaxID=1293975 RepID=A0AA89BBJ6_9ASTE|nr:hypothetical protein RJ639_035068 [Escallonia herrerae]